MIVLKEIKEIILKLRENERHHYDRIKYHKEKVKLVNKDMIMYQTKINNAIGKPTNW